jgi:hypothetical protein
VGDVEHAHRGPHRGVFAHDPTAGVLDRHLPPTEVAQLAAQRQMAIVQRGAAQRSGVGHDAGRYPGGG